MTSIFHPDRPTLADGETPCWLDTSKALPSLVLTPLPDGGWIVGAMLEHGDGDNKWYEVVIYEDNWTWFLNQWQKDPEEFAKRCWSWEPKQPAAKLVAQVSAEELGL